MNIGLEHTVMVQHRERVERVERELARRMQVDESRFLPPRHRIRHALRSALGRLTDPRAQAAAPHPTARQATTRRALS